MKAIGLWQPWATLVAIGAKRIETRHWRYPWTMSGDRIAIYATKGIEPAGESAYRERVRSSPFAEVLAEAGYNGPGELPRGVLVATVRLLRATEMTDELIAELERRRPREVAFGHYAPGRWAWVLEDPQRLEPPAEVPGGGSRQGFFNVELEGEPARTGVIERPRLFG